MPFQNWTYFVPIAPRPAYGRQGHYGAFTSQPKNDHDSLIGGPVPVELELFPTNNKSSAVSPSSDQPQPHQMQSVLPRNLSTIPSVGPAKTNKGKEVVANTCSPTMISSTDDEDWRSVPLRPLVIRELGNGYAAPQAPALPNKKEMTFKLMGKSFKVPCQDYEVADTSSHVGSNSLAIVGGSSSAPGTATTKKRKRSASSTGQKTSTSRFPTSAKQLMSTGIFEGVRVRYSDWRRQRTLTAIIQGCGYKCTCYACYNVKAGPLSALDFAKHAGDQNQHPNRNIFFSNGKSVLTVVQELKETPPDKLFEAMRMFIESPLNLLKFNCWKAIFIAQNPEYGESA